MHKHVKKHLTIIPIIEKNNKDVVIAASGCMTLI